MTCPLLGHAIRNMMSLPPAGAFQVDCPVCGPYIINGPLAYSLGNKPEPLKRAGAYFVRDLAERGLPPPDFSLISLDEIVDLYPPLPAQDKVDRLLRLLAHDSPFPSATVRSRLAQYALLLRTTDQEVEYLLQFLSKAGLVERTREGQLIVAVPGWEKLWKEQQPGRLSKRAFVAIWFDATLEPAWEAGLRLGIEDTGCEAVRVDRVHHNDKICDRIVSEIHRCGFLIADVTGHRQGVYFEAGLAFGLGKPVIWTCRRDSFDDAHFDTRQYNHIIWETPTELRGMLRDRIRATILPRLPTSSD